MDNQTSQSPAVAAVVYLPVATLTPAPFHGEVHEGFEDWLPHHERVARHDGWTAGQCLQNVSFSLKGTPKLRVENHETSVTSRSCVSKN